MKTDELESDLLTLSSSKDDSSSEQRHKGRESMKILVGPGVDDCLRGDFDLKSRVIEVTEPVLRASHHFETMLPNLLSDHEGSWGAVDADGAIYIGETQDEAEIAALDAGCTPGSFIVDLISPIALD